MEELKNQIETLRDSLKIKDDQITTLKDSLSLKDQQINTLEDSINLKEDKIATLEKAIKMKEDQIKSSNSSSSSDSQVIEDLQKEIDILNEELTKSDEELERLTLENEKLKSSNTSSSPAGSSKIKDFTQSNISKEVILEKMREILQSALHNVTIAVPQITDLQELYLYEVRSSVNMKVSCLINPGIELHADLLEEFESLDNISIRTYEEEDRYLIIRDGEELLMAVIGNDDNNHLVFHTRDSMHIKLFNALAMEVWMRSRRI